MKRKLLLVTVLLLTFTIGHGQTSFQIIFGSYSQDGGLAVVQTDDTGYVFTGYWGISSYSNMFLIKTNSSGDLLWSHLYEGEPGPPLLTYGVSLAKSKDNGFIVYGNDNANLYLVKTDENGDTIWTKSYGTYYGFSATCIRQCEDDGFILVAESDSIANSIGHIYVLKTDENGDSIWSNTYGFGGYRDEYSYSIVETDDGGFALLGYSSSAIYPATRDIYLYRTNSVGDTIWTKKYGGSNEDIGYCIQKTQDDGFIIMGSTMSFGNGGYEAYLIKTDSNGNVIWEKTYGGLDNEWGNYVCKTSDGGYILVGSTQSFSSGGYDVYLIKTDLNGNQQWSKTFGGVVDDIGYSVQQTFDGGYIIVGIRGDDIYLIKTDVNGNATGTNEIDLSAIISEVKISPNPFSSWTTLQMKNDLKNATLTIFNFNGQTVKELDNINGHIITLYRDNLPGGLYFIRLTQENEVIATNKLVIVDN